MLTIHQNPTLPEILVIPILGKAALSRQKKKRAEQIEKEIIKLNAQLAKLFKTPHK